MDNDEVVRNLLAVAENPAVDIILRTRAAKQLRNFAGHPDADRFMAHLAQVAKDAATKGRIAALKKPIQ